MKTLKPSRRAYILRPGHLRGIQSAKQQIAHHEHMAGFTANEDKKAQALEVAERAEQRIVTLDAHKAEAHRERQQWMQDNGMEPKPRRLCRCIHVPTLSRISP